MREAVRKSGHVIVQPLPPMDQIIAVDWRWYAILQNTWMINLAKVLKLWTSHMKRIILPLELNKSSFPVSAARIKQQQFIIGAKEETR